ncbi:hypothetical protein ACI75Y_03060 [Capnocytophaga stomatis]|uniref:hypothetical protein n=1 Tax=Capnocytophaga stomatis TaxID=1848904 RepID=UPI00385C2ED1
MFKESELNIIWQKLEKLGFKKEAAEGYEYKTIYRKNIYRVRDNHGFIRLQIRSSYIASTTTTEDIRKFLFYIFLSPNDKSFLNRHFGKKWIHDDFCEIDTRIQKLIDSFDIYKDIPLGKTRTKTKVKAELLLKKLDNFLF